MTTPRPTVDLGYPIEAHGRIPALHDIEEEAAFWDTHDTSDFMGQELRPAEVVIGGDLAERLTLRLDKADRELLAKRARAKGVGPSTLSRMWLKERLREETHAQG